MDGLTPERIKELGRTFVTDTAQELRRQFAIDVESIFGSTGMTATDLIQKIGETLGSAATVKSVFGEPIHVDGKTVIPVAKVGYGFGGGFGSGKDSAHPDRQGEGGGGGGGVRAFPAGALEITGSATRFVPFTDLRQLAGLVLAAFAAGAVFGSVVLKRGRR